MAFSSFEDNFFSLFPSDRTSVKMFTSPPYSMSLPSFNLPRAGRLFCN